MKDEVDNVITLVQPKSEEEGLLNVVITDEKKRRTKMLSAYPYNNFRSESYDYLQTVWIGFRSV